MANTCPHCGANLREHARFCPHCMTALIEKRVIPTPKHLPVRWLSVAAAVLVLALAVWSVWATPQDDAPVTYPADAPVFTTTAPAAAAAFTTTGAESTGDTSTAPSGTTLTTLADAFGANPTDATTTRNTWRPTYDTTGRVPPFLITTTTSRPTTTKGSTTAKKTTTTTKKVTTTAAVPTYPAAWDTVYRSTTEDDLPIEEVKWTYKAAGDTLYLSYYKLGGSGLTGNISRKYIDTFRYNIPLSECIILTGFDAPTENGIYRIPAAIDGKVVVGVDMRTAVDGACQFNDAAIAPTVKRLYLPPELMVIQKDTINQCTALEGIYFGCDTIWIEPNALPIVSSGLDLFSYTFCYMACYEYSDLPILKEYCTYTDHGAGVTVGRGYYVGTTWRGSTFAWLELYG